MLQLRDGSFGFAWGCRRLAVGVRGSGLGVGSLVYPFSLKDESGGISFHFD